MIQLNAQLALERPGFSLDVRLQATGPGLRVLFGPSGSGKSTLLRSLAGLEPSSKGRIQLNQEIWQDAEIVLPAHQRRVGLVMQGSRLFEHLSVESNLVFGARRRGGVDAGLYKQLIQELQLEALLARPVFGLSGGEAQRVALGRALLSRPELILLDEPLASLDEASRQLLIPVIRRVAAEALVVHVTHSLDEADQLADEIIPMEAGRTLEPASPGEWSRRLSGPFAHRRDTGIVYDARLSMSNEPGLVTLDLLAAAGSPETTQPVSVIMAGEHALPAKRFRLRLQARDISLSLKDPGPCSILNRLPATVVDCIPLEKGHVLVNLELNPGLPLLARISARSAREMKIKPGLQLLALIKGAALAGSGEATVENEK